jgi:hypothetical protein
VFRFRSGFPIKDEHAMHFPVLLPSLRRPYRLLEPIQAG